jgi:hypothetical protein
VIASWIRKEHGKGKGFCVSTPATLPKNKALTSRVQWHRVLRGFSRTEAFLRFERSAHTDRAQRFTRQPNLTVEGGSETHGDLSAMTE